MDESLLTNSYIYILRQQSHLQGYINASGCKENRQPRKNIRGRWLTWTSFAHHPRTKNQGVESHKGATHTNQRNSYLPTRLARSSYHLMQEHRWQVRKGGTIKNVRVPLELQCGISTDFRIHLHSTLKFTFGGTLELAQDFPFEACFWICKQSRSYHFGFGKQPILDSVG